MSVQTFQTDKIHAAFDHYFTTGDFNQMIVEGQNILEYAVPENQPEQMKLGYLLLIKAHYYLGEIEKSYEYTLHYKQLIEKLNCLHEDFNFHYIQAHIHKSEKNFDNVQQAIEQCTAIARQTKNDEQLSRIKIFYSGVLLTNGQLEQALSEAQLAQELLSTQSPKNIQLDFRCQLAIASALYRLYKQQEPLHSLHSHIVALQNPFERCRLFYTEALDNIHHEQWDVALVSLTEASTLAQQNNALLIQICVAQHFATIYEQLQRYKEALDAMKHYNQLKELFYKKSTSLNILELDVKHNLKQMKERATIDPLSGVYNRYYLEERATDLLKEAMINNEHICCIVFDLDNFKAINDTYGHLFGDEVIKMLGRTCNKVMQNSETTVVRYGGDEFVILAKCHGQQNIMERSQQLFDALTTTSVSFENTALTVSISMGIACNKVIPTTQFSTLFHAADQALYQAKKQGKNQLVYVADF